MILRWLLAALHLVALGLGAGAILNRSRAFASPLDAATLKRLFQADNLWGLAALLWLTTGLWRAFGSMEKPAAYYWANHAFWLKMALFVAVVALEILPMLTLIRWRAQSRRGEPIDGARAPLLARISRVQFVLIVVMVFVATAMARGVGY